MSKWQRYETPDRVWGIGLKERDSVCVEVHTLPDTQTVLLYGGNGCALDPEAARMVGEALLEAADEAEKGERPQRIKRGKRSRR